MTLITYPLDDCDYSADDAALFHCTRTSGIFASDDFSFSMSGADNTVRVSPGIAWMRINKFKGLVAALKNEVSVDLGLPDSVYSRIDRVVLQYNANTRDTTVVVKRGVPRSNPLPPDRSTQEALYELHLLEVLRKPAAASVKPENVTDLRFDSSCCGLMADSVTKVDTSAINAQATALVNELRTKLSDVEAQTYYASKEYVDASVRKAAPRNLLDNSDFTNLVAQAGIGGNHGTIAYAADRWILDSGTVSYAAGVGLTLNGTIRQKLEYPPTGETSAFVGMASGAASISYADGAVTITSSGGVLKWAALYGGVYTETTKPEYQPKGYGAELAECQRYYRKYNKCVASVQGSEYVLLSLNYPPMRVIPSVSFGKLVGGDNLDVDGAVVSYYEVDATGISVLRVTGTNGTNIYSVKNVVLIADL